MIKKGFYRHFKGNIYELLDIARNSETLEDMAVYRSGDENGTLWVRPLSMWDEEVAPGIKRFEYIGVDNK